MNKNLKIGLGLLITASVFLMCSTVAFFILKESEKEKRAYIEAELKKAVIAKEDTVRELGEIKIINKDLESKLSSARDEAKKISEQLAREKASKESLTSQLEEEKRKSDELLDDVMKEKEERLGLVHKLTSAEGAFRDLNDQYKVLMDAKETLEARLKDMMTRKGVELERIEVRGSTYQKDESGDLTNRYYEKPLNISRPAPSEKPKDDVVVETAYTKIPAEAPQNQGAVLVVNRKFDFIVSNLGKADGINIGMELDVYRKDKLIARTCVEKLYEKMSASTILPDFTNAGIREGDQVFVSSE
ncbi:MAG: hypothetical protein HQ575_03270 [Candidatus Omnitrophica bacterium]|nr:hypothetical protein [Candidatus Omnitrophota bacterium]